MKKAGKVIGNIFVTVILIFSIIMTVLVISSTIGDAKLPNLFGKAIMSVQTDSMDGPNGFPAGALIVVQLLDKEQADNLKVGDVVTYTDYYEDQMFYDTHRIVDATRKGSYNHYTTKGDNTVTHDKYTINCERIIGIWTGISIPHLGTVMDFLQSQLGFMLCVVIPTAIFFFFELFKFISVLMESKKEKALAAVKDAEEEIKQRVVAEMLAKQEAEKSATEKKPEAPAKPAEESEEEIKRRAVEEYIAQQEKAAREEEIKKQAIAEYLAKQAAEKKASEDSTDSTDTEE